jgi:hypothetical protein
MKGAIVGYSMQVPSSLFLYCETPKHRGMHKGLITVRILLV